MTRSASPFACVDALLSGSGTENVRPDCHETVGLKIFALLALPGSSIWSRCCCASAFRCMPVLADSRSRTKLVVTFRVPVRCLRGLASVASDAHCGTGRVYSGQRGAVRCRLCPDRWNSGLGRASRLMVCSTRVAQNIHRWSLRWFFEAIYFATICERIAHPRVKQCAHNHRASQFSASGAVLILRCSIKAGIWQRAWCCAS
jgi:hypothetical protein